MSSSLRNTKSHSNTVQPTAVTISADDLFRMKALAEGEVKFQEVHAGEVTLRQTRKEASAARAARWPNTLEALRHRKEQTRKDMIAAHEAKLIKEDEESQAKREEERQQAIQRAHQMVKEQSEKFKIISNFRQRSYDMDILNTQNELKAQLANARRREEEQYHQKILADLAASTEEETRRLEAARAKAREQQLDQKRQIQAVIDRRIQEIKETEEQGKQMLIEIEKREKEAYDSLVAKRQQGAQQIIAMKAENQRLQALRTELKKSEAEMMNWIAEQAATKEAQDKRIRSIIDRQRDEANRKAQIISDLMTKDYNARKNSEDTRVDKEVAQATAKAEAIAAEKARKQAEMRASIDEHIRLTQQKTLDAIRAQMKQDEIEHADFVRKLAEYEASERAIVNRRRDIATGFKNEWLNETQRKKETKARNRQQVKDETAEEDARVAIGGPADQEFAREVAKLVQEETAKGHSTQPLQRLVHKVLNPPLISGGGRI